jgi:hypothetical protein
MGALDRMQAHRDVTESAISLWLQTWPSTPPPDVLLALTRQQEADSSTGCSATACRAPLGSTTWTVVMDAFGLTLNVVTAR